MGFGNRPLDATLQAILEKSFFIRVTMTRRRSGTPRTVETTYVWDGARQIVISGYPGPRDWVANMGANPDVTLTTGTAVSDLQVYCAAERHGWRNGG